MSLTDDERRYFDEKFASIERRLKILNSHEIRLNNHDVKIAQRPTIFQVIAACGFFLGLGLALGAAFF